MPLPAISPGGLPAAGPPRRCRCHQPETTLLYPLVEQYYPAFVAHLKAEGRTVPHYVQQEFTGYLKCCRLEHGFLRVHCESCHREKLVTFSCKRRGFRPSCGARRMVESTALLVDKVERLCRYITRPAVAEPRLSFTPADKVRYELKTPFRNGTTHVIFEPVDFIARLAALVPKPRVNLTRFHGVFARNGKHHSIGHWYEC